MAKQAPQRWANTILKDRIRTRLEELNLSPRAASLKAGLGADAVRIILDGRSLSPRGNRLSAIARALDCDVRYLLGEMDAPGHATSGAPQLSMVDLPIRGEVAAGVWLERDELQDEPLGMVPAPRLAAYEDFDQWLERVKGNSMNRLGIVDGSLVHVIDAVQMGYAPRDGDVVVVLRTRAQGALLERSVKQVAIEKGQVELWGRSYDDRYNVPLSYTAGLAENEEDATVEIVGKVAQAYLHFPR